jgi:SAM-dependent methyltransferase
MPTIALNLLTAALALLLSLRYLFPKWSSDSKLIKYSVYTITALLGGLALLLTVLNHNAELRGQFFAKLCKALSAPGPIDDIRCPLVNRAHGNILEIGPGPGTNFRCFANTTQSITSWTGVEPNKSFEPLLKQAAKDNGLEFPVSTTWLTAEEDYDVQDASVDSVISTHVLCSVDSPDQVLKGLAKTLKKGGKMYFMEHAISSDPTIRAFQTLLSPAFTIIANGCKFIDARSEIEAALGDTFDLELEDLQAPMPLSVFKPHVVGIATKR